MSTGGLDDGVAGASAARRTPLLPPSIVEVNGGMAALHDGTKGADAPFPELLPDTAVTAETGSEWLRAEAEYDTATSVLARWAGK